MKQIRGKMELLVYGALFFLAIASMGCSLPGGEERAYHENVSIKLYFCPEDDCEYAVIKAINDANVYVHCAFYDLDLENLTKAISIKENADVKVVIDKDNYDGQIKNGVKLAESKQYMHNKFCIMDGKIVLTGSMNPTRNDAKLNNNNLLLIESKYLSKNYEDEFEELWNGVYSSGSNVAYSGISTNLGKIENYFCPEDCDLGFGGGINRVIDLVRNANESIKIAAFSFTHEELADELIKATIKGINVTIVVEARQRNVQNSQYERLRDFGINIKIDGNKHTMHHKFAIIDKKIVVTGSTNFTLSGNNRNDENMIIIFNKNLAQLFIIEFNRLFDLGN